VDRANSETQRQAMLNRTDSPMSKPSTKKIARPASLAALAWRWLLSLAMGSLLGAALAGAFFQEARSALYTRDGLKSPAAGEGLSLVRIRPPHPSQPRPSLPPVRKAAPAPRRESGPEADQPAPGPVPGQSDAQDSQKTQNATATAPDRQEEQLESQRENQQESQGEQSVPEQDFAPLVDVDRLDPGFEMQGRLSPRYPARALRNRRSGMVRLALDVNESGRVERVTVLEETPGWGFADAALAAAGQISFSPPTMQGRPVRVRWLKTLVFRP